MKANNLFTSKISLIVYLTVVALTSLFIAVQVNVKDTSALSPSDFNPGRIIDDAVFYNSNAMTAQQIQTFLNERMPNCDTNGTGTVSYYYNPNTKYVSYGTHQPGASWVTTTRAVYGERAYQYRISVGLADNGSRAPYSCLKDYRMNVPQQPAASGLCSQINAMTNTTSAQIIKAVADACGINPQVILVILEKEQSLVQGDNWPFGTRYSHAMGYACPDTAACDVNYEGLFKQIYHGAKQYKIYQKYPNNYNYRAGQNNIILFNPDSRCGTSNVFIENQATAGLYIYTPYQPNQATKNWKLGSGGAVSSAYPGCGAFGNINFFMLFSNWFGSTKDESLRISRSLFVSPSHSKPVTGESISASFVIQNNSKGLITVPAMKVIAKSNVGGSAIDFPTVSSIPLSPGQTYEYYKSVSIDTPGDYQLHVSVQNTNGTWSEYWPYSPSSVTRSRSITVQSSPDLSISRSLYYSPATEPNFATTKDKTSVSFILNNETSAPVKLAAVRVSAHHISSGEVLHYPEAANITINPGEEYTYLKERVLHKPGDYRIEVNAKTDSGSWVSHWPKSLNSNVVRSRIINVAQPENISVVRNLWVSPLITGQSVGASFIIKNNETVPVTFNELSIRATDSSNNIKDFPSVKDLVLQPGEEYTYYQFQTFDKIDTYTFQVQAKIHTTQWVTDWPQPANNVSSKVSVTSRLANITMERNLWRSPVNLRAGQAKSVSFVIKNNENRQIRIDSLAVGARYQDNSVVDFPHVKDLILDPGQSYEYYQKRVLGNSGSYRIFVVSLLPNQAWSYDWPTSVSSKIIRSDVFTVAP